VSAIQRGKMRWKTVIRVEYPARLSFAQFRIAFISQNTYRIAEHLVRLSSCYAIRYCTLRTLQNNYLSLRIIKVSMKYISLFSEQNVTLRRCAH
jgi:hypothetical protein